VALSGPSLDLLSGDATTLDAKQPGESSCPIGTEEAKVSTPANLFKELSKIDILQLNCEGCEYAVLDALLADPEAMAKV